MRTRLAAATLLLAAAMLAGSVAQGGESSAQDAPTLGVDANPEGNTATSLGSPDRCLPVKKGATFQVDIFVTNVASLQAWEVYFVFDQRIVTVTDRDTDMFLAAAAGSNLFDASESLPSESGLYRAAAVDIGEPKAPESGAGVLARLTLHAVGAGVSELAIGVIDPNDDGKIDLGPALWDPQGLAIGDANGDDFFDGPFFNSQIAVDTECSGAPVETPLASPTRPPASATAPVSPTGQTTPASGSTPTQGTASPTATTATATPTADAVATSTPTVASPTPVVSSPPEDEGTDWGRLVFIAAFVGVGTVAVLAVGGLALFSTRRRRS